MREWQPIETAPREKYIKVRNANKTQFVAKLVFHKVYKYWAWVDNDGLLRDPKEWIPNV